MGSYILLDLYKFCAGLNWFCPNVANEIGLYLFFIIFKQIHEIYSEYYMCHVCIDEDQGLI